MSIDVMKQALAAIRAIPEDVEGYLPEALTDAVIALRAAIEQAQEPVAWLVQYPNKHEFVWGEKPQWIADAVGIEPLYTAPRQWQGLTADEIWQCNAAPSGSAVEYHICMAHQNVLDFAEAIEAKLKEKNT